MATQATFAPFSAPDIHIYADSVSEEVLQQMEIVRDQYLPEAFLFHAKPHVLAESGSWNILQSIKSAAKFADEVYLVEEDVWVYPYFFKWHQSQTADISCGRRMLRWPNYPLYTNPGSRFSRRALDLLLPHINDDYYRDQTAYCARFPNTSHLSVLDDGLIRRVVIEHDLSFVFPEKPVCAHVGIPMMGKLDIYQVEGKTLEERIISTRNILTTPKNPRRYAILWEPYEPS